MKSDFLLAITQLSAEKNLPKEVVLSAVEAALVSAYRKDNFAPNQNISVKINQTNGRVQVWAEKMVVERVADSRTEVSLSEARRIKPDVQPGEMLMIEATPENAGRIAAQTAKQVILQRLHEAEHSAIFEEFAGKEGDIVTGIIQRIEPRQVFLDLGRTEGVLVATEQAAGERYRIGQRIKVVILEVARTPKGPRVMLSRSHPDLLRRLFEMEVPEISHGVVEIKSVAREAGSRSKVAVHARQEGVDPVGCCVGLRGIRIQNIVNELGGEKIDVVQWSAEPGLFIAHALSPAQTVNVTLNEREKAATVVVPDKQLSLAIGKEGQNVRLAAKLTGWRIDIKAGSAYEAEKAAARAAAAEKAAAEAAERAAQEQLEAEIAAEEAAKEPVEEPVPEPVLEPVAVQAPEALPAEPEAPFEAFQMPVLPKKSVLRFAEDIMGPGPNRNQSKSKKKKKKTTYKETDQVAAERKRREVSVQGEDEY